MLLMPDVCVESGRISFSRIMSWGRKNCFGLRDPLGDEGWVAVSGKGRCLGDVCVLSLGCGAGTLGIEPDGFRRYDHPSIRLGCDGSGTGWDNP